MSGRKRALVGLDARMAARLAGIEERLSSVKTDYDSVQTRIAHLQTEEENRAQTMLDARQQAVTEAMAGVERRFLALETSTASALADQQGCAAQHNRQLEADMSQTRRTLASLAFELDQQRSAESDQWRSARETLEAALCLEQGLQAYYPARLWKSIQPRIHAWLEESEAELYRGQTESGLLAAQQAYLDLQELRLNMEAEIQHQHRMRMAAMLRLNEVLALAKNNAVVQVLDLNGQFLDVWIDVNQWSGGILGRTYHRASALLQQVTSHTAAVNEPDWRELLEEQIPALEQAVCEAVGKARTAALASQVRFNIAERVVAALAEQGYLPTESGWQDSEADSYQATLHDYSGSQVIVHVSPASNRAADPSSDQAYQLEINFHSQDVLSEHILHQSSEEIYATLRRAGLNVHSVLQPTAPETLSQPGVFRIPQRKEALQQLER